MAQQSLFKKKKKIVGELEDKMSEVEQVTFFQLTFDPIDSVFKIKVTLMVFLSCNA